MNDYSNPAVIATSLAAAAAATVVPGAGYTVGGTAATPEWFTTTNTTPTTYHDMQSIGGGYEIPYHHQHHHPQTTVTLRYSDTLETIDAGSVSNDEKSSTSSDGMSNDDTTSTSTTILMPMVKRGRPTENPCWSYFHRIDDQLVRCRICTKLVKSACATNMTKHLERHHSDDYEKLSEQIRLYRMNDASFRTKIQYLTHMNPPQSLPPADDSYLVPKIEEVTYDTPPLTASSTVPLPTVANTSGYYDYTSAQSDSSTNWHLSHFWEMPPPATVIQSTSSVTSAPTVPQVTVVSAPKRQWNGTNAAGNGTGGERPYMKRNRKTEHPVWEYFKRTGDGNAECTICGGVVKSPCSSNFMRHLMRHHTAEYNDVYMKWVQKRNQTQQI